MCRIIKCLLWWLSWLEAVKLILISSSLQQKKKKKDYSKLQKLETSCSYLCSVFLWFHNNSNLKKLNWKDNWTSRDPCLQPKRWMLVLLKLPGFGAESPQLCCCLSSFDSIQIQLHATHFTLICSIKSSLFQHNLITTQSKTVWFKSNPPHLNKHYQLIVTLLHKKHLKFRVPLEKQQQQTSLLAWS